MRSSKKLMSVVLVLCMLLSVASVGVVAASADTTTTYETYAQETIQGSNILHCFNWSYNQIKANLPDIARAGYTAVQTSPVQSPKDYNSSWTDTPNQWWKLYQPLGFSISDGSTWLGTKAQLTSLCTEADNYGIKVIVDIVANHLANNGTDGGTFSYLNSGVEGDLKNANYYHTNNTRTNDDNRYNITQYHLGMPDLNTGNSYVQQRALGLLEECIDCGVDGFRFDAAKHIELPTDQSNFRSNFWPTVINGATNYAQQQGKETPFYYGEILGGAGTDISNYTQYMAITDNHTGDLALDKAYWRAASELANSNYDKGASPSDSVLWAESHDTYMGNAGSAWTGNTSEVENTVINRAWAIVGARADSTALFFARPNSTMGYASTDGNWKSTAVAAVNKFKNHFAGTNEYLANSGDKVAYIERGTKGVVISKLDGGGQVSLTAHQMADGTYKDQVSGGTFTVSNHVISGNVDSQGVAVVYNTNESAGSFIEADALYLDPGISGWKQSNQRYAMYVFNSSSSAWVSMTDSNSDGIFEASVPAGNWTGVIFCTMNASDSTNSWENKINQTVDLFPTDGNNLFTITGTDSNDNSKYNGTWSVYSSQEEETTETTTEPVQETTEPVQETTSGEDSGTYTVYAYNAPEWSNMKVYYWGSSTATNPDWPGNDMSQGGTVYTAEIPSDATGVIFNNGNGGGNNQTVNIEGAMIHNNAQYYITPSSNSNCSVEEAPTYYLIGSMSSWNQQSGYAFALSPDASGKVQYKLSGVSLPAGTQLKVNDNKNHWYPGGSNNNYTVPATGTYDVYFRPNGDGNNDWHQNYFYLVNVSTYTVTWKNGNTVLETDENVPYGQTPTYDGDTPTKPADSQNTYTFTGWSPTPAAVTGDVTYTAQFASSSNTYTVTWKNGNETLATEEYAYGATPTYKGTAPTKAATAQYTYTFNGWSPAITAVTTDATYTAQFSETVNTYTVTWQDEDGTELNHETYAYGETPTYKGTTPAKAATAQYTYTFNGWVPTVASVSGDVTYKATYSQTVNTYTVTWKNGDTTLDTETYEYGATPTYKGITPAKADDLQNTYAFDKWSPAIEEVKGNATYTATFTSTPVSTYNITVNNAIGWDDVYVYYWLGGSDNSWPGVAMTASADGFTYTATIPSTAEGIIFNNGDTSNMKQTANITTGIADGAHWVVCNDDNDITFKPVPTYYLVGTMTNWQTTNAQTFAPVRNPDGLEEYKLIAALAANAKIKAYGSDDKWYPDGYDTNYTVPANGTYEIYFRPNGDGNADWHEDVLYVKNVTEYTVTWLDGDGNTLKTDTVTHGDTPSYSGETPTKTATEQYTYFFNGTWTPAITEAAGNVTYMAQFDSTVNQYNITWKDYKGDTIKTDSVAYGETPAYSGETPTKPATAQYTYTFNGWSPEVVAVTTDATYTAQFSETVNTYTVIWQDEDGTELDRETYAFGDTPTYKGTTPAKAATPQYTYTFNGWVPTVASVSGDATYKATYSQTVNTYTVTWKDYKGDTIKTDSVAYGETPAYSGETPTKPANEQYSYTFSGWSPEVVAVTGEASYTAQFTQTAHTWHVVWTWNGYESADALFSCTDCAKTVSKAANITSVTTAPTMTAEGSTVYTATVTGPDGQTYTDTNTEVLPVTAAHLAGHTISLDGDIAVNFYMKLDSALANSQTAYMQFTVPDTSDEYQSQKVYVKDLTPVELGGKTYYVFKCRVAAKDMDSVISAQLVNGNDVSETYTYSVRGYANYLLNNLDVPAYAAAENLVRAMLAYGDHAKANFNDEAEALASPNVTIPEYTTTVEPFAEDIYDGISISLRSQTTLSIFFKSAEDLTLTCDGYECDTEHVGKNYVIRIRNIAAADLHKPITVKVNGENAVTSCPLTYCYRVQDNSNTKLANTVKALYNYWLAAKNYFGGIEPEED